MKKKIIFLVNPLSFFISHRLDIAYEAINQGYKIVVIYGEYGYANDENIKEIQSRGISCIRISFKRGNISPLFEIKSLIHIYKIFNKLKPDIVHLITTRAYLYGGIAAKILKIPCVISAVAGLGALSRKKKFKNFFIEKLLSFIFYLAFNCPNQKIIFQNYEDKTTIGKMINLDSRKTTVIKGSGVNLSRFNNLDDSIYPLKVCFASRLLREKGVFDYIESIRILKNKGVSAKFLLAGSIDLGNPDSLTASEVEKIKVEKLVEYIDYQEDIPSLFSKSHIVCLPSYYGEGLPKILQEAAAASRAVVTTDIAGCRDAIIPNKTGLLVPPKNPIKLAESLEYLILNPNKRISMGKAGRKLAEKEFDIKNIIRNHIEIYQELLNNIKN